MVWKYQNEIAPIFYYGISTKFNEKDIKISKLQPPDWKSPYWMSLYIVFIIYMTSYPQLIVKKFPLLSIDKTACAVEPQPNTTRVKVPGTW